MSEEERKEEQEANNSPSFLQKAKTAFNKAKASRYATLLVVVVATVIISLYQVGWRPDLIGWSAFIANTALLLFLGVYGMFFGETEGTNMFKQMPTGLFQKIKEKLDNIRAQIVSKGYLDKMPDYIVWRYQKDYENKCKMHLLSAKVFDNDLLKLTDEQLNELRYKAMEINGEPFSKISDVQYQAIMDVRDGRVTLDYIEDHNFFIMETANDGVEQATRVKNTAKRKEKISWKQRVSRILFIVIIAVILAGFFKENPQGGGADRTSMLLSRLSTLLGSIASGFNTARLLNLEDIFVMEYKLSYNTVMFYSIENGTYVPLDIKEKARKDVEEQKKKDEEAIKNVVEAEVVVEERHLITQ